MKFTERRLQELPTPAAGQRATYRDADVEGLELRVTDTGTKSFSWYRRVKQGKPERVTIGRFPEVTVIKAREEATKLNAIRVTGDSPVTTRKARQRAEMAFGDLFGLYLERHAKVHKKTWKEDQQRYDQYLARPFGNRPWPEVTREEVTKLHGQITKDGHPAVANRVVALVSSVFGRGIEWSIVKDNPVKGIRRNRELSRDRFLGGTEMPRFMASLQAEPNEVTRDFFLMLLLTGARRANVLSMAWADIDLGSANWRIPDTKAGEPLNVPLTSEAMDLLKRRQKLKLGGAFVFPGPGVKGHLVDPKKAWDRLFDRDEINQITALIEAKGEQVLPPLHPNTGATIDETVEKRLARVKLQAELLKIDCEGCRLQKTRIHDLRRTQGSWQATTGASLAIIGKGLGHKNVATTAIYARLQTDPVRASMTKATEAMLEGVDMTAFTKLPVPR